MLRRYQQVSHGGSCCLAERLLAVAAALVLTVGLQGCQGVSKRLAEGDSGRGLRGVIEAHWTGMFEAIP